MRSFERQKRGNASKVSIYRLVKQESFQLALFQPALRKVRQTSMPTPPTASSKWEGSAPNARKWGGTLLAVWFFDVEDLIGRHVLESLDLAARPGDFQQFDLLRVAEAEMHSLISGGKIAAGG